MNVTLQAYTPLYRCLVVYCCEYGGRLAMSQSAGQGVRYLVCIVAHTEGNRPSRAAAKYTLHQTTHMANENTVYHRGQSSVSQVGCSSLFSSAYMHSIMHRLYIAYVGAWKIYCVIQLDHRIIQSQNL